MQDVEEAPPPVADAESLRDYLARTGKVPAMQALALSVQLLASLHACHQQGLVHGAIHPARLRVTRVGQLQVADCGRPHAQVDDAYRAPELRPGHPGDVGTDLYAAAVVIHELFTGVPAPRRGGAFVPGRHGLPAGLDAVFVRALARAPERRYRDASALSAALLAVTGLPVWDRPAGVVAIAARAAPAAPVDATPPAVRAAQPAAPRPARRAQPATRTARKRTAIGAVVAACLVAAVALPLLLQPDSTQAPQAGPQVALAPSTSVSGAPAAPVPASPSAPTVQAVPEAPTALALPPVPAEPASPTAPTPPANPPASTVQERAAAVAAATPQPRRESGTSTAPAATPATRAVAPTQAPSPPQVPVPAPAPAARVPDAAPPAAAQPPAPPAVATAADTTNSTPPPPQPAPQAEAQAQPQVQPQPQPQTTPATPPRPMPPERAEVATVQAERLALQRRQDQEVYAQCQGSVLVTVEMCASLQCANPRFRSYPVCARLHAEGARHLRVQRGELP